MMHFPIVPRSYKFDFSLAGGAWLNNDIYLTHMFNTSSIVLPEIECFVNFAVCKGMKQINDTMLREQCVNFIQQEVLHAKSHLQYNAILKEYGFSHDEVVG